MSRSLRRALWLVLIAACTRKEAPPSAAAARATSSAASATRTAVPQGERISERPAACLAAEPYASAGVLAEEGRDALAADAKERALACAEEALRLSPRLVQALAVRAEALAALGRVDDARLAYVRRLGPSRDALEAGLEYALRGARAATARKERTLAARLVLVAGMAENDLGRSHLALPHLEKAVAALPDDPDVVYERGVALFELCRFQDAERSFARALALAPEDAWAMHQLGLLAERRGDRARAESLLARARKLAPDDFPPELAVDEAAFRGEVQSAIAGLPEAERRVLAKVPLDIQDLPDANDLVSVDPPLSPSILGLFRGPAENEPCTAADGPRCRSIVIYRKNLVRFARDRRELDEQVRVTLLHELGHLHGENDDELRARGLE